jgi:hypothetical protein
MEFMPERAPLVLLMLLGTCFLLGVAGLVTVYGLMRKRRDIAKKSLLAGAIVAGGYLVLLLGASLASSEKVLAMGQLKYFCEIDCHEAYSVVGVRATKTIGDGLEQKTAAGTFYIVTVKVWFDEKTISSRRPKDMLLYPNARTALLNSARGQDFTVSLEGQRALEKTEGKVPIPFTQRLKPGESYITDLVFDVPSDVTNPRLYITLAGGMPGALLIGHERSLLHKKILFDLAPPARANSQR